MTEAARSRLARLLLLALVLLAPAAQLSARQTGWQADWQQGADPANGPDASVATLEPPLSELPVSWRSREGLERLQGVRHIGDFQQLANQFEPQKNDILCGPTSAIIVMNALRGRGRNAQVPEDSATLPEGAADYLPAGFNPFYRRYTQDSFFNADTDSIKTRLQVYGQPMPDSGLPDYGLQLRQLYLMLLAHGLEVQVRVVDDDRPSSAIVRELIDTLREADHYILVNFSRQALDQPGGGHFSPLAAYDRASHSFLIMDTVPLTSDWFWVSAERLVAAMRTFDTRENRGYLLISDPD
jgi:hypothetical protein